MVLPLGIRPFHGPFALVSLCNLSFAIPLRCHTLDVHSSHGGNVCEGVVSNTDVTDVSGYRNISSQGVK